MAITAEQVRDLRERTGAGMMECKKALTESVGDMDKAVQLLRERGQAVAAKREGKQASEGVVVAYIPSEGNRGVMVELNCETDFVARNETFQALAQQVAEYVAANPGSSVETVIADPAILNAYNESVAKLGERLVLRRIAEIEGGPNTVVGSYIHMGGKIGVMVEGEVQDAANRADAQAVLRDVAMHISWSNPIYKHRDEVPEDLLAQEREVHETWARNQGKPEAALPNIIKGRMEKFYEQSVLLDQPYVREQDKSVQAVLNAHPSGVTLKRFVRMRVGEE